MCFPKPGTPFFVMKMAFLGHKHIQFPTVHSVVQDIFKNWKYNYFPVNPKPKTLSYHSFLANHLPKKSDILCILVKLYKPNKNVYGLRKNGNSS